MEEMSACPLELSNSTRRWRFTWETLAHISSLRLYLFNPEVADISVLCRFLEASLRLDRFLLLLYWPVHDKCDGSNLITFLRIPVPRVLIDPGFPVDIKVRGDHIEAKLLLLLPVNHPVEAELFGASGIDAEMRRLPLSMCSDREKLSSDGVNFFCKSCSTRLTRQPLRNFVEIPSTDWQEVADNWFGGCCSFGGASEKMVAKYMETFGCKEGTCLLDRASVAVCIHDLEGSIFERTTSDTKAREADPSYNVDSIQHRLPGTEDKTNVDCWKVNVEHIPIYHEKTYSESAAKETSTSQQCLKAYGNGFMSTPANLSNNVEYIELSCWHCSSPLGSYSCSKGTTLPAIGGAILYKCYISTSYLAGAPDDVYKKHTLETMFTNLLIEAARDELSFHIIVCNRKTKIPMLQIVLLNSSAWCCSGFCYESTETENDLPAIIYMEPVVKLLFLDCDTSSLSASPTGAEEVYMMNREVEQLKRSLKLSVAKLPHSCTSLQGMSLSFLGR